MYANIVTNNINQYSTEPFNTFFIKNKSDDDDGGVVYVETVLIAVNTSFSRNIIKVDDGAIHSEHNVNIDHCLFESNKAEGS